MGRKHLGITLLVVVPTTTPVELRYDVRQWPVAGLRKYLIPSRQKGFITITVLYTKDLQTDTQRVASTIDCSWSCVPLNTYLYYNMIPRPTTVCGSGASTPVAQKSTVTQIPPDRALRHEKRKATLCSNTTYYHALYTHTVWALSQETEIYLQAHIPIFSGKLADCL